VNKFKYFFGSDSRSVPFLESLLNTNKNIKVVTLKPKKQGRGRKLKSNPVEDFAKKNKIDFLYFSDDILLEKFEYGIVASFAKIFTKYFLRNHKNLYNIHLSLLPELRGPTPVENTILNNYKYCGYTIFKIDEGVDTGNILYQHRLDIVKETYASEVYTKINNHFKENVSLIDFNSKLKKQSNNVSFTTKFSKSDFDITGLTLFEAKRNIRAFDVIGPAYIKFSDKFIKIHNYFLDENTPGIELIDGIIYPNEVTPEGKKRMKFQDYMRGLRW